MSRRPLGAAHADPRPIGLTRKEAAPRFIAATAEDDPAVEAGTIWLTRSAEHDRLTGRWQNLETYLIRERDWFKLGKRARAAIPEAAEFEAINRRLAELQALNGDLLVALPAIAATTPQGLASKLAVAATHVRPDENAEAHDLIASILRDLQTIVRVETERSTLGAGRK